MKMYPLTLAALLMTSSSLTLAAPTLEEMWETMQKQQQQIEQLSKENKKLSEQLEMSMDASEKAVQSQTQVAANDTDSHSSIGGYGELHFNSIDGKDNEIDFHRFVLFF